MTISRRGQPDNADPSPPSQQCQQGAESGSLRAKNVSTDRSIVQSGFLVFAAKNGHDHYQVEVLGGLSKKNETRVQRSEGNYYTHELDMSDFRFRQA